MPISHTTALASLENEHGGGVSDIAAALFGEEIEEKTELEQWEAENGTCCLNCGGLSETPVESKVVNIAASLFGDDDEDVKGMKWKKAESCVWCGSKDIWTIPELKASGKISKGRR